MRDKKSQKVFLHCADYFYKHENLKQVDMFGRYNPTIFVGQYEVCDWHERLGGGTQADSIMDRIIHNSYSIPTTENNLRKLYDSQKARKLMESLNS